MRYCIKWFVIGGLLLLFFGVLLWQMQDRLADRLLSRYVPDLHYSAVELDSAQGRLVVQGVAISLPGVDISDGELQLQLRPASLVDGPVELESVVLRGLKMTVAPTKLAAAEPSSPPLLLPNRVAVVGAEITLVDDTLPNLQPLHLGGSADHKGDSWSFQWQLALAQGVLRTTGNMVADRVSGAVQLEGVRLAALLQQLGIDDGDLQPQGVMGGHLSWSLPPSALERLQVKGDLQLQQVAFALQGKKQQLGNVAVRLAWLAEPSLLQLQQITLKKPHLRWQYRLNDPSPQGDKMVLDKEALLPFGWQLDRLRVDDGLVDVGVATAAGMMPLALQVARLDVRDVVEHDVWPQQVRLQAALAGGKIHASFKKHALNLKVKGVPMATLEPLVLSVSGLRTPQGSLNLNLQGAVGQKLKLFGELAIHQLVVGSHIPISGVDGSIPYGLGLRALTDDSGVTRVPLAIRGTVDKPDVDVAQIVSKVKQNLFNASLHGDMTHLSIDFLADQVALTLTGEKALDQLVQQLKEGSKLRLLLRGCVRKQSLLDRKGRRKLAAQRVALVQKMLKRRVQRRVNAAVVFPAVTAPSSNVEGRGDRVEVDIYPQP